MASKRTKTIIIATLLCILIAVIILVLALHKESKVTDIDMKSSGRAEVHTLTAGSKRVMENDSWLLELDEERLAISLTDKVTGETYSSARDYTEGNEMWNAFCSSGVTLEFYSGNSTVTGRLSPSADNSDITIEYYDDGFDADIECSDYDFGMQLQVRLTEDGISVLVPGDSIREGEEYLLGSVWLYPMLGSTYLGEEEGYMLIPEGSGALIDLADNHGKYKNPYSKRIYGENVGTAPMVDNVYGEPVVTDPETIKMPVFGMVYTQSGSGFLGVVTEGEYNAMIAAYPNGVITPYNWISSQFMVRDIYIRQTARNSGVPAFEKKGDIRDLGIRYFFVSGDEASYTGLARRYRQYLLDEGQLENAGDDYKVKLDFLGADSTKWFVFDTLVRMTGISDMADILEDLRASGADSILASYQGWQQKGVTLAYGSSDTKVDSKLGTSKELRELKDKLSNEGIDLKLKEDILLANASKLYNTTTDIVKGINQVIVEVPTYQKLFPKMYYLTPSRSAKILQSLFKNNKGIGGDDLELSGITDNLFSYYSAGKTYTRADTAAQQQAILSEYVRDKAGFDSPGAYLWKYMDSYYDMSLQGSGYNFISQEIPFLPIVLRGSVPYWASYVNFQANEKEYYLKLLEYGAYPAFLLTRESPVALRNTNSSYIYTSEYSVLKDKILDYEESIGQVLSEVEGCEITDHRYLEDDLVFVSYDNGASILINYGDKDVQAGDITVPAMSYYFTEAGQE
ncbi:DUF5696 domain-containing protein [Butyrivibrio sp. MC2013]|uniref:DUF5696 domain-containing protein n=1 Tax=Butyrivibrio sp. MC2013 TaxID=1280686 RepID=UPI0003FD2582|nr:DUF5696 domain-containing protein [Butyrivibrio sp. MC2013]